MIKRPKPGESEEDLLEFQRQFLTSKESPAASSIQQSSTSKRDVVRMQGMELSRCIQVFIPNDTTIRLLIYIIISCL